MTFVAQICWHVLSLLLVLLSLMQVFVVKQALPQRHTVMTVY